MTRMVKSAFDLLEGLWGVQTYVTSRRMQISPSTGRYILERNPNRVAYTIFNTSSIVIFLQIGEGEEFKDDNSSAIRLNRFNAWVADIRNDFSLPTEPIYCFSASDDDTADLYIIETIINPSPTR